MKKWLTLLMAVLMLFTVLTASAEMAVAPVETEEIPLVASEEAGIDNQWWNILLLGDDSRSKTGHERTDCMIILSVNLEENLFKMSSIVRDTWVELPGLNRSSKINAANVYGGPELAIATVNENFGMDIENYILVNMTELMEIIDMLGGVELEVTGTERQWVNHYAELYQEETGSYAGDTYLDESGMVHLNGLLATSYARNRYTDNDFGRSDRHRELMLAIAKQAQNMEVDELMALTEELAARITTNLDSEQVKQLAKVGLIADTEEVEQLRLPVDGTFDSGMYDDVYKVIPDLDKNTELLHNFIYQEAN